MKNKIYSESQYYTEIKRTSTQIQLVNQAGVNFVMPLNYLEVLDSADTFTSTVKLNQTELIKKLMESSRVACSIYFQKASKVKTKKAFKEELAKWTEDVKDAFLDKGISGLNSFATNPVLKYTEGEMREIKGYHLGITDERGRLVFKDMEDSSTFMKAVDLRTIEYIIVQDVKYIKK